MPLARAGTYQATVFGNTTPCSAAHRKIVLRLRPWNTSQRLQRQLPATVRPDPPDDPVPQRPARGREQSPAHTAFGLSPRPLRTVPIPRPSADKTLPSPKPRRFAIISAISCPSGFKSIEAVALRLSADRHLFLFSAQRANSQRPIGFEPGRPHRGRTSQGAIGYRRPSRHRPR